jgi:hypothetical protein
MFRNAGYDSRLGRRMHYLAGGVIAVGILPLLAGCTVPATTPSAATSAAPSTVRGPFDGDYNGAMTGLPGHDVGCRPTVQVIGMHVGDGHVSFGSFSGTIGLDGKVDMRSHFEWVMGQFAGTKFIGTVTPQYNGCSYRMELERAS